MRADIERFTTATAQIFGIMILLAILSLGIQQLVMGRVYGLTVIRWSTLVPAGLFFLGLATWPSMARTVDVLVWITLYAIWTCTLRVGRK